MFSEMGQLLFSRWAHQVLSTSSEPNAGDNVKCNVGMSECIWRYLSHSRIPTRTAPIEPCENTNTCTTSLHKLLVLSNTGMKTVLWNLHLQTVDMIQLKPDYSAPALQSGQQLVPHNLAQPELPAPSSRFPVKRISNYLIAIKLSTSVTNSGKLYDEYFLELTRARDRGELATLCNTQS